MSKKKDGQNREEKEHRGGNEPPSEAQDRPEQNRGYDEAVRGGPGLPVPHRDALDEIATDERREQDEP